MSEGRRHYLLTLSAVDEAALRRAAGEGAQKLAGAGARPFPELATAINESDPGAEARLALAAASREAARQSLAAFARGELPAGLIWGEKMARAPQAAFICTGQGAQYPGMGRALYHTSPVFRQALDACEQVLRSHLERPLTQLLFADDPETAALIHQTAYTQPALFSLEYALARWWQARGIQPAAVMGHSVGEYVAATLAGVFSLADGLKLIAERGRLMGALPAEGTMAAVFAGAAQVEAALAGHDDRVGIAAINGPTNVVISGAETAVRQVLADLKAAGVRSRRLTVSHAFHSPLMAPMLDDFQAVAESISYREPQIRFISNVTGREANEEVTRPAYWREHVRRAVRFADSLQRLHEIGYRYFLEIGPEPVLIGMGKRILPRGEVAWLPSLQQGKEDWALLLGSLGRLYVAGATIRRGPEQR
jgi:acyl transferase domain-containing protein